MTDDEPPEGASEAQWAEHHYRESRKFGRGFRIAIVLSVLGSATIAALIWLAIVIGRAFH